MAACGSVKACVTPLKRQWLRTCSAEPAIAPGTFPKCWSTCFWTFESIDEGRAFLEAAFGAIGGQVAAAMKRPRLTYNVAVYHKTFGAPA